MSKRYRISNKTVKPCSLARFIGVHALLGAYFVFTFSPAAMGQQVVVAGTTNTQTGSAGNGVPVVNIAGANGQGVSVNQYNQFNVANQGLILNNSTATTTTQLGGYILGNANLVQNGPAKVILNEVVSSSPSALNGYMEVAGHQAAVVVANPNGISCNGCGFINTSRATLTTGKPVFGGTGSLDGFRVTGGTVSFNGAGLNASNVSQVDVLARAVQLNAAIYGNNLNVITGANLINYANLGIQVLPGQGTGTAPNVSLDVGALGGMYAGKISIIGTEAGVGVNSLGKFQAQSGDFTLNSQGDIVLGNTTAATGNVTIDGANVTNSGLVYAAGDASLNSATGTVNNTGTVVAGSNLAVQGANVQSTGVLASGINPDGSLGASGDLSATAQNQLMLNGEQVAGGNLSLTGGVGGIDLSNAITVANGVVALTSAGGINAPKSELYAGALSVTTPGTLTTTAGSTWIAGQLGASVGNWNNAGGVVAQTGSGTANVAVSGVLTNASGTLQSSDGLVVQAGSVDNTNGQISASGLQINSAGDIENQKGLLISSGATQVTAGGVLTNEGGQIGSTGGVVTVQAGSMDNTDGLVVAMGTQTATLNVANALNNGGQGTIASNGALAINAGTLSTDAPSTIAGGDVVIHTTGTAANAGTIQSNAGLSLNTAGLTNTGQIQSAASTTITSSGAIANSGSVQSGGALTINASNQVATNSSLISSNGALTVTAATLDNTGGALVNSDANGSATNVVVSQGLINQGGVLGGTGDVSVNAGSINNNQGQLVSQGGALAVTSGGALANAGGLVQSTNELNVNAGSIDNTAGTISSVGTGAVTVATSGALTNAAGTNADGTKSGGIIGGNGNVSVSAGTLSNSADGQIISGGDLAVSTSGQTTNRGAIQAGGALNLTANGLNNSGAIAGTASTTLASSGAVTNTYLIQSGGALSIAAQNQSITNSGTILGNGVTSVQAGSLDNSTGQLVNTDTAASSTMLMLDGQFTNQHGVIGGQGDVVISAANIDNGHGQLVSTDGALTANTAGVLTNTSGLIQSGSNAPDKALAVTAGSVDNTDGQIVGLGSGSLALTVAGALTNGGQGVIGSNGNVTIAAGTLSTDTASQITGSNVLVSTSGTATNAGKVLSIGTGTGSGTLTLNTAGLTNSGTLASNSALQLNDTTSLTNTGTVQSGDALSVRANNLTNSGVIASNGALTVAATSLNNNGGKLINQDDNGSATTVTAANALTNEGGTIGGVGATTIGAESVDNNGGKLLSTNNGLTLTSAGAITNTNNGLIQGSSALSVTGASLDNTGGSVEVVEAQPLNLSVTGLLNNGTGGFIGSNGTLNLSYGTFTNAGALFTGQDLSFASNTLFTNTGSLESGGTITVNGNGIDNSGTLSGNRGVSLTSSGAVNNTGNILSGAAFTLDATGQSVTNSGFIYTGGVTGVTAGSLNNTGGTIANTDTNASATTVTVADALINKGGVIGGQGNVGVTAGSIDNSSIDSNNIGQLLSIGGTTTVSTTGALNNAGGLIQSNNGMTVSAASLDNTSGQIKDTGNGSVTIAATGALLNGGSGLIGGNHAVTLTAGTLNTDSASKIVSGSTLNIATAGAATNAGTINSGDALNLTTVGLTNTGSIQSNAGLTLRDTGTTTTNSSLIQSNGVTNIAAVNLNNSGGTLVNGDANQSATTVNITGALTNNSGTVGGVGDVVINAASINNATTNSTASKIISSNGSLAITTLGAITNSNSIANTSALIQGQTGLTVNAASVNNQGGQVVANGANAALDITTSGAYDNSMGGTTGSNGTTTLHVGTLANNTGGTLSGATSLNVASAGAIDNSNGGTSNSGGVMLSGGAVTVSGTAINNADGQIGTSGNTNSNAALFITGTSLDNTAGTIANNSTSGSTTINLSGTLTNASHGTIQSNNGLTISAVSINNSGVIAQLGGDAELGLTSSGAVTNGGTIGSNGSLAATVGSLNNVGGTLSAVTDLHLTSNGAVTNDNGAISSGGALEIDATNQAISNQNRGTIQSVGAATITASSLNNSGGSIFAGNNDNASPLTMNVASITNQGGNVGSYGDTTINAATIDNSANGQIQSNGNLTINLGNSLNNNSGAVSANNQLSVQGASATVNNTSGSLSGNGGVTATLAGLTNTNGTMNSYNATTPANTTLTLGSWSGDGTYNVGGNLTVSLPGDFTNNGNATYNVAGMTTFNAAGTFTNAADLELANGVTINAANVWNQNGATIASGGTDGSGNQSALTRVNAAGTLQNEGSIDGPSVQLTASTLNNTGTVLGENVGINADTINNGFDPGDSNFTDGYAEGTITATNQLNVITHNLTNTDATIQSYGTLTIAGNATGGNATLVDNKSGLIQTVNGGNAVDNTLTINANTITNELRVVTANIPVGSNVLVTDSDGTSCTEIYAHNPGSPVSTCSGSSGTLTFSYTANSSAQSQIISSGDMNLNASVAVNNDASLLLAANNININSPIVNNPSISLEETVTGTYTPAYAGDATVIGGVVTPSNCSLGSPNCTYVSLPASFQNVTTVPGTPINGVIEANGQVTINAGSISNTNVPITSLPGARIVNVTNASNSTVASAASVTSNDVSGQALNNNGPSAPSTQVNNQTLDNGNHQPTTIQSADLPTDQSAPTMRALGGTTLNNGNRPVSPINGVVNQADQIDQGTSPSGDASGDVADTLAHPRAVNDIRRPVYISLSDQNGTAPAQGYSVAGGAYDNFSSFITSGPFLSLLGVNGANTFLEGSIVTGAQSSINQRTTDLNAIPLYENNSNSQNLYASFLQNGVPVTPVTVGNNSNNPMGSLISGSNVVLMASGDIINGGTLQSGGELDLIANNFTNNGGTLKSGGNLLVNTTGNITDNGGLFSSGGNMLLMAGGDLGLTASTLNATGSMGLLAGGDINFNTTQSTTGIANGWKTTNNLTSLTSGGDMAIYAGNNLTSNAAQLTSGGALSLGAGNNLTLQSVINEKQTTTAAYKDNTTTVTSANDQTVIGTALKAVGDINLDAVNTLTMAASSATLVNGAVNLSANTVNLSTVNQESTSDVNKVTQKSGFLSHTTTTVNTATDSNTAVGSTLSGSTVNIASIGDTILTLADKIVPIDDKNTTTIASITGTNGINIQAGGNINIDAATNTSSSKQTAVIKKSGLLSAGWTGISIGMRKQTTTTNDSNTTQTDAVLVDGKTVQVLGSTLNSTNGDINLNANNTYTQTASNIQANNGDVNIQAGVVNIQSGANTDHNVTDKETEQIGLSISLGGTLATAVTTAGSTIQTSLEKGAPAINADTTRGDVLTAAGDAASLATVGADAYKAVDSPNTILGDSKTGSIVDINVSLGYSDSKSHTTTDSTTQVGSAINGNNVTINANGNNGGYSGSGDLNVVGSRITGTGNVALDAANNLNLTAAQNTKTSETSSYNFGASIGAGLSFGGKNAFEASVNASLTGGTGSSSSASSTNENTTVTADNQLTLTSGNNTTLAGAVAKGNQVTANVGGNLEIESLQDTSTYDSSSHNYGLNASVCIPPACTGMPGSIKASYSQTNMSSDYASVGVQSGIVAESGGFNVTVAGNTNLIGGVISSTAIPNLNTLTTGTLTASNIRNSATYSADTMGVSAGYSKETNSDGTNKSAGITGSVQPSQSASGNASSMTQSAVSAGTIAIADLNAQSSAVLNGLDRNTSANTAGNIAPIFNPSQISAEFAATKTFQTQVSAFSTAMAGATSKTSGWQPGGIYNQMFTALASGAGGNASGSVGQFAQASAVNYIQQTGSAAISQYINENMDPHSANAKAAQVLLQGILGCAGAAASNLNCSAGATGAAAAALIGEIIWNAPLSDKNQKSLNDILSAIVVGAASTAGLSTSTTSAGASTMLNNSLCETSQLCRKIFKISSSSTGTSSSPTQTPSSNP